MERQLNLNSVEDYDLFLKIKSMPRFSFTGRTAEFPDEYAKLIGLSVDGDKRRQVRLIDGLFDYQGATAKLAIRKRKFAVFMGCGYGKTLILTEFVRHATANLSANKSTLIVSPLMVIQQTIAEVERFYGKKLKIEQVRASGLREWLATPKRQIGITNYEAIVDDLPTANLGCLALDESSMLKSHYGKWGTRLIEMGKGLEWKLCLTGTPAPNDRIEYANHAVFLDHFPTVNSFLARFFVNRGQTGERWELKPHALLPFYRALSHWCIFVSDPSVYGWSDNVSNIPPINVNIHHLDLTDDQRGAAMTESKALFAIAGGITSRAKLAQIAKGNYKGEKIESLKPAYIANMLKEWPDESTIIWCKFNKEQEELASLLPDAANISGDTPDEKRIELIRDFQAKRRRVMISKPKILGFGLNLQVCTRMIFSTLHDSYEEYHQALKRANRIGSTKPLNVHIPLTEIEVPMVDNVLRKSKMVDSDTREQERIFRDSSKEFYRV